MAMRHLGMLMCCVALLTSICGCAKKFIPSNRAQDEGEIRQLEIEASKAIAAKDLDKLVSLYAEDGALYDDRTPSIRGKKAIRATWQTDFARPSLIMSTEPQTVEIASSGELAWAHGDFAMTINNSLGRPVTEKWQYALIYTKQLDGKWKIMADSANSLLRSHLFPRAPRGTPAQAALAPLIGLACFLSMIWFFFGMPVVALVAAWRFYRSRKLSTGLMVSVAMLIAFFLTALLVWGYFSAHEWNLPLAHAFRAATDTIRYGNPVEDSAEGMLVGLVVLSTFSAAAVGIITGVARWAWTRCRRLSA
jgi:uncharacterized protein (TIGR02246 family)